MIRTACTATFAATFALAVAGAAAQQSPQWLQNAQATAQAQLEDTQGKDAGTVTFGQFHGTVVLRGELRGLPPGWHAIHVHETGACTPDFEAAGDHFNPAGARHGMDEAPPHAGDLPNIFAAEDGTARFEFVTRQFALGAPATAAAAQGSGQATPAASTPPSLFDGDGAAIVVHEKADDYRTDPSGESGGRIACGVIERS